MSKPTNYDEALLQDLGEDEERGPRRGTPEAVALAMLRGSALCLCALIGLAFFAKITTLNATSALKVLDAIGTWGITLGVLLGVNTTLKRWHFRTGLRV